MAFKNRNSRREAANLQNLVRFLTIRYLDCMISTRPAPHFGPESFVNWYWFMCGVRVYIFGIYLIYIFGIYWYILACIWYIFGIYFVYIFGITWFKLSESKVCIWLVNSTSLVVQTQLSIPEWAQGISSPCCLNSFIHQPKTISGNRRWDHR